MPLRLTLILLSLGLVYLTTEALQKGISEYRTWRIGLDIGIWDKAGEIENDRQLATHIDTLNDLLKANPDHPGFHFLASKLHEWRAHLQRVSPRHRQQELQISEDHLKQTVSQRPLWARAWGALLVNNALQTKQWNPAAEQQLEMTTRFGRYDIYSQYYLIQYTFRQWNELPPGIRTGQLEILHAINQSYGLAQLYLTRTQRSYPNVKLPSLSHQ